MNLHSIKNKYLNDTYFLFLKSFFTFYLLNIYFLKNWNRIYLIKYFKIYLWLNLHYYKFFGFYFLFSYYLFEQVYFMKNIPNEEWKNEENSIEYFLF